MIDIDDLPFDDLKVYGITLTDLSKWDAQELVTFLSYGRTKYRQFNIKLIDNKILSLKGKLSLNQIDNILYVIFHFPNLEMVNAYDLNEEDIQLIKKDFIIFKDSIEDNNKKVYLYQKDRHINDVIKIDASDLPFKLSRKIKRRAHKGKEVEIGDELIIIDLNEPNNFKILAGKIE